MPGKAVADVKPGRLSCRACSHLPLRLAVGTGTGSGPETMPLAGHRPARETGKHMDNDRPKEGFDLDQTEIRVLGVLIEKAFLTPDNYPMSINAITTGCNQQTGRDPVTALAETEVQHAIDRLSARRLVSQRDSASARVPKYEHLVRLRFSLPPAEQTVLALLMLRGPQTAGELRQRAERMHAFADIAAVEAALEHLADKFPPMVMTLPRAPGTKEARVIHLLGGELSAAELAVATHRTSPDRARATADRAELVEEVARLREEVAELREAFARFKAQFE